MARYWGLPARRFLQAVQEGRFEELLGDAADSWREFSAAVVERGGRRAVLRLYAGEEAGGPYFLWVLYGVARESMTLEGILLPTEDPASRLRTPEELAGEPFFAFPPGEPRRGNG